MGFKEWLKKSWDFLKEDSWPSFFVGLILAFVLIKLVIFPGLSLLGGFSIGESFSGRAQPLVIVESCSMYHRIHLENIVQNKIYSNYGISYEDTSKWSFKKGFTKGDIIWVSAPKNIKVGDVLIFEADQRNPIIHRVIGVTEEGVVTTKGDNNLGLLDSEKEIYPTQFVGKAVFKIPALGWIKLIFFDWKKPKEYRGFC